MNLNFAPMTRMLAKTVTDGAVAWLDFKPDQIAQLRGEGVIT